jgi:NhaA family Na+:H+ antiporter
MILGKSIGIGFASWLAVKLGISRLPTGVNWNHIHGAAWLGGIGFTMSLFIAALAFSDQELLRAAKIGVLTGSLIAGVIGVTVLLRQGNSDDRNGIGRA